VLDIAVAEDNPTNRKVLSLVLDRAGHRVRLAGNGEELLDLLEAGRFDLVIADIQMPEMGGLEALRLQRVIEAGQPRTPWLVVSANATREAREEALAAGADAYLSKPVDTAQLLQAVSDLTGTGDIPQSTPDSFQEPPASAEDGAVELLEERVLQHIEQLAGGAGFLGELFDGFLADAHELQARIEQEVVAGRLSQARDELHALRGSAGSVGAQGVFEACGRLSELCKAQRLGEARAAAAVLPDLLERTAEAFAARRARTRGARA
jgi:two-component system sensor histidine kinase RpfC